MWGIFAISFKNDTHINVLVIGPGKNIRRAIFIHPHWTITCSENIVEYCFLYTAYRIKSTL